MSARTQRHIQWASMVLGLVFLLVLIRGEPRAGMRFVSLNGAPSDGSQALRTATLYAIRDQAWYDPAAGSPCTLDAWVEVGESTSADLQPVKITWLVRSARGDLLGTVTQKNETLPKGALSLGWGDHAKQAAEGAMRGIAQLIDRCAP